MLVVSLLILFVLNAVVSIQGAWKQLGSNSYGNYRSPIMGRMTDWNLTLPSWTAVNDMLLMTGPYLMLRTTHRDSGRQHCGIASINYNTGELVDSQNECSYAYPGTISKTIDGIYVYAQYNVEYNYTTVVSAMNGKMEKLWTFNFQRELGTNQPVAVIPVDETSIIVITGEYTYPESGIGSMYYSRVYSFDTTGLVSGSSLKPTWKKTLKRGGVLYYQNYLYFKSIPNMLKVHPHTGKIVYEDPITYPRVYSNMVVSEKHNTILYNCGLPLYADMNHNQCSIRLDNFTVSLWTYVFPGDHQCMNIALSNDEDLLYVQCKFGDWTNGFKIAALDVVTGKLVRQFNYTGVDWYGKARSVAVMDDGSVVVPMPSAIRVFDSKLKRVIRTITWDKGFALYGNVVADNFKCFSYCLSARDQLYGRQSAQCTKVCT